jgi:SAM-dependent methyltransferase
MKKDTQTPDFGNWVPRKMLYMQGFMIIAFMLLAVFIPTMVLRIIFAFGVIICLVAFVYFSRAYYVFSYKGDGLSGKILDMLLSYIQWNGKGNVLDIGCGSGALSIKLAKKFPDVEITGIDYWGKEWDYNKKQCQQNAVLEGVSDRIDFLKGDASQLPFENECFDIVVSNFTFHEVKSAKDKKDVIKEALRVIKKGGIFAFHDLFYIKSLYGEPEVMLTELRLLGISEINIKNTTALEIIPKFLQTSFMLGGIGIIYGRK